MSIFTKKPTTVTAVFEKAVADVRVIQKEQSAKADKLSAEQDIRVQKLDDAKAELESNFKEESAVNSEARAAATQEKDMAGKVIDKFADLFGISAE